MVTRTQVDRLPVLHRAKRLEKVTLSTPFELPFENFEFENSYINSMWIKTGSPTPTIEVASIGGVANVCKVTMQTASNGLYIPFTLEPDCGYRLPSVRIYVPSGQIWATRRPGLRIIYNSSLTGAYYFTSLEKLTVLGDEDTWKEWTNIDLNSQHYRWFGIWMQANAIAGNVFYFKVKRPQQLERWQ